MTTDTTRQSRIAAARLAAQAAAVAGRKGAGDRAAAPNHPEVKFGPVSEQRHGFTDRPLTVKTEKGQPAGRAYRRRPHFETLAMQPLDKANVGGLRLIRSYELRALRFYRSTWEGTQASETRCALDVDSVRGGLPSGLPVGMVADYRVKECDRALGAIGDTMRAVALHDMTFSDVAIQRWGGRERQRIVVGTGKRKPKIVNEIVPRSGRHREQIRREFLDGLRRLTEEVERLTNAR